VPEETRWMVDVWGDPPTCVLARWLRAPEEACAFVRHEVEQGFGVWVQPVVQVQPRLEVLEEFDNRVCGRA
jgi:hypothetical protein